MRLIVGSERHWPRAPAEADLVLLRSPDAPSGLLEGFARRLDLQFNDIVEPRVALVAPDVGMMRALLAFGAEAEVLAVFCYAGVSRSTAAAYAVACQLAGPSAEDRLARDLRRLSPAATPNPLMVALADDLLRREGRMVRAVSAIGRGVEAFEGPLFDWQVDGDPAGD